MRIVYWQTILMEFHTFFYSKIKKDVTKFVVCCSRDWRFNNEIAPLDWLETGSWLGRSELNIELCVNMGLVARKPVFGVFVKARLKPVSSTETS